MMIARTLYPYVFAAVSGLIVGAFGSWYVTDSVKDAQIKLVQVSHAHTVNGLDEERTQLVKQLAESNYALTSLKAESDKAAATYAKAKEGFDTQIAKQSALKETVTKYVYVPKGTTCEEKVQNVATDYFNELKGLK